MRKLVIIPTYNEKENISAMIDKVFSLPEAFEMLVIDDGSPDGTAAIVKKRQQEFPATLHLLERSGKQGLGTAYLTATSRTIPTIWYGCTRLRPKGTTWWSVRVTCRA